MAATPSRATPALSREFPILIKTPPSLRLPKPDLSLFLSNQKKKQKIIRSELKSFENSHPWSLENDRIHLIHSPSANPMTAAATLDPSSSKLSKKICLFYCAETKALAERVAAEYDGIELRSIRWRTFADGFPNLFISNAHGIRGQHVAFLASFSSPGVIFEQLSVIYALPRMFISSFTLVLPFFPTGSSERMEEEGDVATAFTLARILSNIPISRGGPTSLVIFDIHALQERFYFGDKVLPCFESGVPLLKNRLQELPDSDNISIAFPDDGAWKRFNKLLQHFPMKVLADNGAAKISAYVTHGIFPNRSWERFQHDNGGAPDKGLTYFWITDSCPLTVKEVKNRPPFEILSLAGSIAATLQI